jgi:transcription elongation factor B subunit 2
LKKTPEEQRLFDKGQQIMDDTKLLSDYGYLSTTSRAQSPETIGLVFKLDDKDTYEQLDITPLSTPPDLPDVMKSETQSNPSQTAADIDK